MKSATIVGLGLDAPAQVRTNDAWPASFAAEFAQRRIAKHADFTRIEKDRNPRPYDDLFIKYAIPHEDDPFKGTKARRVAPSETTSLEYETRAARAALADAKLDATDIDVVVASALLPDALCPSPASAIQHSIGATRAAAIGMEAYCASALAHLDYATALVASGAARYVLCVQSHIINDRINLMDLPFSPLFGDAASAFVVGPSKANHGVLGRVRGGDGSLSKAVTLVHRDAPEATWYRDAAGQVVPGSSDADATKRLARGLLAFPIETLRALSDELRIPLDAVQAFVSIQPTSWYLPAVAEGLALPPDRFVQTFDRFAHIGACAIVANLLEAKRQNRLVDGALLFLYAHGAGVTRLAFGLRWHATD